MNELHDMVKDLTKDVEDWEDTATELTSIVNTLTNENVKLKSDLDKIKSGIEDTLNTMLESPGSPTYDGLAKLL
jgi:peptidoglycan hydrolase CwlO-like protein